MSERQLVLFVLFSFIIGIFVLNPLLIGQEPDLSDPETVANQVLNFIQTRNAEGMLMVMDPDQKQAYLPFTPDKQQEILRVIDKDKEKVGRVKKVSELRECTTFSGKPGIAAKVRRKSSELYVIILSKQDNLYYYDNLLTITPDAYKNLKLVK